QPPGGQADTVRAVRSGARAQDCRKRFAGLPERSCSRKCQRKMQRHHDPLRHSAPRRRALRAFCAAALAGTPVVRAFAAESVTLPFANGERPLARYPQKRPLIVVTQRPPQLETPFEVYNDGIVTPHDAFLVRYHLAGIPTDIDATTWRLSVKGRVQTPLSLSLADLKQMEAVEYYAVNQCSGNSRGFFEPRVAGGQIGNGAMGNAKWRGVPLRVVLARAGVRDDARQVKF